MTTPRQDREFIEKVLPDFDDMLSRAIEWIGSNMDPSDVFTSEVLEEWSLDNGFVRE